jgi:predicted metal-dependent peptidase
MGKGEDHSSHFDLNKDATPEETEAIRQYLKKVFTLHGVKASDFGIDEIQSGVLRWKSILRNFVNRSIKTDCKKTRNRPNRRHGFSVAKRVYDRKPELVFLADSSGSMVHDFPIMANEVFSLCRDAKLEKVDVYYIDTELHEKGVYRKGQQFPPVKGGGGTAFTEGLNELGKKLRQGQSVIFFTDTCTDDWPQRKPPFPLLIIATEAVYNGAPDWVRKCAIDASELLAEARKKLAA